MVGQLATITLTDPGDDARQATISGVQVECVTWSTTEPGRFVGTVPLEAVQATGWPMRDIPRALLRFEHESGEVWVGEVVRLAGHSERGITLEAKASALPVEQASHA